jgi:hypothetical protein
LGARKLLLRDRRRILGREAWAHQGTFPLGDAGDRAPPVATFDDADLVDVQEVEEQCVVQGSLGA